MNNMTFADPRRPTSTEGTGMATFLRIAIVAAAAAIQQPSASAAEFPSRSITIVVPYTAGGPTDTVARLIAGSMSQTLKTPVLIENVGGAGGTRGAFNCMDHSTRLRPRRLLAGTVSTSLPAGSNILIFILP